MERRTLYALLARPVRRWEFLLGKYAGLVLTLAVNTALMTLGVFAALLYVMRGFTRADAWLLVAVYFILLKLALVTALALLFSCFSTPLLSTVFTIGIYVTGLFAQDIRGLGALTQSRALRAGTEFLYYVLPNFSNFNVITGVAYGRGVPASLVLENTGYAAAYIALVLLAAAAIFSNRNLK